MHNLNTIRWLHASLALALTSLVLQCSDVFVETESVANPGGWVVDSQFLDSDILTRGIRAGRPVRAPGLQNRAFAVGRVP